jgi:hypothetical protein
MCKRPKNAQNIKRKKSSFAEKILNFSSFYGKNIFFSSKTSSDRLKPTYKMKLKKKIMSMLVPLCRVLLKNSIIF